MRLIDFFDHGVALFPDRACLADLEGRSLSFTEVQALTHRIGNRLVAAGVQPQLAVAVLSPNDLDAFACILGTLRSGAAWMPINARNGVDENVAIMGDNECCWLFYHSSFADAAERMRREVPTLLGLVCIDRDDTGAPDLVSWLEGASEEPCDVPAGPHDIASFWPSGGTTGRSKGVLLTHLNFETMIANFISSMPYLDKPPVHLIAAPMTHAAGCVSFPLLAMGATQVISPGADALTVMQSIETHKITTLFLPPTVIYMMLSHARVREFDYSSLRHMIYAAAPMSTTKLIEAIEVFGPVMAQTYGQAETPMVCTYMAPEQHVLDGAAHHIRRLTSCGRVTPFTRLEIMDDDGRICAPGETGEIVVRGNMVMKGYYRNPAATEEASRFGWHHTGDVGTKDEDGFVYIVDRKRDMIISGGFNLYPSEIEQVLWAHPAVEDCAVIGVPDDKWGEAAKAIVQLKQGVTLDDGELERFCRSRLGGMKTPKSFEVWDELPRSPVGKVLKRIIRDKFWVGRDRKV
jgi:acyl-CoA synthetase (AMP-forming)/AMP-acid ligase II